MSWTASAGLRSPRGEWRALIQIRPILFALGLMLCTLAAAMVLPALVDLADGNAEWQVFFASAVLTFFMGGLLVLYAYEDRVVRLGIKEGFLLTTLAWLVVAGFAAIPFIGLGLTYTDAFFETMSGLTTTGATVIVGLDQLPRGVLLWRALLCGIGGLGIIAMAIIILPFLRVGGMQLFQTESSDRSEKILPRAFELMLATAGVYFVLILACTLELRAARHDAVRRRLPCAADARHRRVLDPRRELRLLQPPALEVAGIVFMALGAMPFVVFIKAARGSPKALWDDAQVRGFLTFLAAVSFILAVWLTATREIAFVDALRASAFNVTSIVTTTGFVSTDYQLWGRSRSACSCS